ncbi:MAG: class I SAM-dependent methyltransferase [Bacteroidota bacterium]
MNILAPTSWKEYQLLDSGDQEKLERFGKYILRRPEPQAVWSKSLSEKEWASQAHAQFIQKGSHSGQWDRKKNMPDQWFINYQYKGMKLRFRLGMTAFKHVGIFPEQAVNWNYIYDSLKKYPGAKTLNLFAYTGGASLAAKAAGANVIHCDSIRSVINWAKANMEASKLSDIRWLIEDAYKFVAREARRGNAYHAIMLDPPAWGHGPKGEKWKLEDMVNDLTKEIKNIMHPDPLLLIFNSYSLGFSPLVLENLVLTHFSNKISSKLQTGELCLPEPSGRRLPMGIVTRFAKDLSDQK